MNTNDRRRAACAGMDPEIFFRRDGVAEAKAACAVCPVRQQCLDWAQNEEAPEGGYGDTDGVYANREMRAGVYGGLTALERWAVKFPDHNLILNAQNNARNEKYRERRRAAAA